MSCGACRPGARTGKALSAVASSFYVIRTNFLADIAAENMVAHQRPQMARHEAFELDGEIRNAAARIENIGPDETRWSGRL